MSPRENILRIGEDIKKGVQIFAAGRRLRAQDLGALTGVGIATVPGATSYQLLAFSENSKKKFTL